MTGFTLLCDQGLKAHTLAGILGWTVNQVEEAYIERVHVLNSIEKDYYHNEYPRVQDSIKEWLAEFSDEEKKSIRREYLIHALPQAKRAFFSACARIAKNPDDPFQVETLKELQELERHIFKLGMDLKIMDGKEEGITPEQIVQARQYPITSILKTRNGMALCPFHSDKKASLDTRKNFYHCYGCGAQGDVIDLVMKLDGLTFKQAINRLS